MKSSRARAGILGCLAAVALFAGCRRDEGGTASGTPTVIATQSGIQMVLIPAGTFRMGSEGQSPDERPVHEVKLNAFFMDRFEVVQAEFKKHQISDPSHFKGERQPLGQINWADAALYCNERSLMEGLEPCYNEETWDCNFEATGYRLPTEAEWEYACRAGGDAKYSFGNSAGQLATYAWFADNSAKTTHPVGEKKPNAWGLYDMHGNVAEWCNDRYDPNYYAQSPAENPRGSAQGQERVLRGGAWNSNANACRSAYRASDPAIDDTCLANDALGFRCVKKASAESPVTEGGAIMPFDPRPKTGLVYDDVYLEHKTTAGHPESPKRLTAIVEHLKANHLDSDLAALKPQPASTKWIETIHTPGYVERARRACAEGDGYLDTDDVPISTRSYEAAVLAVGGVLTAVDAVMKGQVENAFCAVRPPGHHAMADRAMGFCIFNNVAIGARYVQQQYHLAKVLIVDWDVHHGNGTQAAFYDDPSVMYFSVHQYPFYPGSGTESETGRGKAVGTTINVPLPAGSDDDDVLEAFEKKLTPAADAFRPDFVFVSAGFDAHENDTLGGLRVTTGGFGKLTRVVKDIAVRNCQGRLVSVLEGGYGLNGLASSVETHLRVLMD